MEEKKVWKCPKCGEEPDPFEGICSGACHEEMLERMRENLASGKHKILTVRNSDGSFIKKGA